jgi:hypothetical protein
MASPRYNLNVFGNSKSSPFDLKETVLRVFKLNEVCDSEVSLFRLQFDLALTTSAKMKVIESWVNVISHKFIR